MPENELPEPPPIVYAKATDNRCAHWLFYCEPKKGCPYFYHMDDISHAYKPRALTVIPHPHNDPEAVAIIERAKEAG